MTADPPVAYLDASAAVKLIQPEPETPALIGALAPMAGRVSSVLLEIELRCTARRQRDEQMLALCDEALESIYLLQLTPQIRTRAGQPFSPPQRAMDALHIATALDLTGYDLVFVTYDGVQAKAARECGLTVLSP